MKINSYESFCSYLYVSRETYEKFEIYHETLFKWQNSINLISNSTLDNIWVRHFIDSGQLYRFTENISGNILDFGSGAGFPGLILAMMGNNNINIVESDQKKCTFIREVAMLSETNIKIYNCRIEDLSFLKPNLIMARALAPLNKLIKYVENYMEKRPSNLKDFPNLLFLKGKSYKNELLEINKTRKVFYYGTRKNETYGGFVGNITENELLKLKLRINSLNLSELKENYPSSRSDSKSYDFLIEEAEERIKIKAHNSDYEPVELRILTQYIQDLITRLDLIKSNEIKPSRFKDLGIPYVELVQ